MPLSDIDKAKLRQVATDEGVDPAELIAEAERIGGAGNAAPDVDGANKAEPKGAEKGASQQPKLFMYLLPYVRVREVRQTFLGLTEAFPGDDEIASDWATAHPMNGAATPPGNNEPA